MVNVVTCVFEETVEAKCSSIDIFCEKNGIDHIDFVWMDTQVRTRFSRAQRIFQNIDYIYTEYYDEEMYEGCRIGRNQITSSQLYS